MKSSCISVLIIVFTVLLSSCYISKSLDVGDEQKRSRGFYSIEGSIDVGTNASIGGNGRLISGSITIGENASTRTLATIEGNIKLGPSVTANGSINTVSGNIEIAQKCTITGNIGSIEGDINVLQSVVHGNVEIMEGELSITDTEIRKSIIVRKKPDGNRSKTRIVIGPNSIVEKIIVKNSPEQVSILIHDTATVGSIEGFDGYAIERMSN